MYWLDIAPRSIEARPYGRIRRRKIGPSAGATFGTCAADYLGMRPLIGVTTSELRPSATGDDAPPRRAGAPRDGARDDLSAHARRRRRDPRRAPAGRHRPPRAAARPPRRHLPVAAARTSTRRPTAPTTATRSSARPSRAWTPSSSSLARMALDRGLPILAICRGAQALNVACGGTLHQHIDGHRQTDAGDGADARGRDRGRARACTGSSETRTLAVNSFHHQAVDQIGAGLRVVAPRRRRHDRGDRGRRLHASACSGTPRRWSPTCRSSRPWLGRLPVPNCASPRDTLGGVPALRLRGVVKRFGALTAVDHLDLEVPEGTCVGLLGPNGAGKSTTMRLLTAQAIPDEGEIEILGLPRARAVQGGARPVRRRAAARQPRRHAHRRAEPARVRAPLPGAARRPQGGGRARAGDREPQPTAATRRSTSSAAACAGGC